MQPSQIRVFDGLRITTEHVNHLQGALQSALRDLRTIAGAGVHRGLAVQPEADAVTIQPGLAIDPSGNRLVCDEPIKLAIAGLAPDQPRFVCLRYDSVETAEVEGRPTLVWDSCAADVREAAPAADENVVVLARVVKAADGPLRVESASDAAPADEPAAEEPGPAGLQIAQGLMRLPDEDAGGLAAILAAAVRAQTLTAEPLAIGLARREAALAGEAVSVSCQSVLSAAFAGAAEGEAPPPQLRLHATGGGEATFTADTVQQFALSTLAPSDGAMSRPSLGADAIVCLAPELLLETAEETPLIAVLRKFELRARLEPLATGGGFAVVCEALWTGEAGEPGARAVEAALTAAHWELSLAWKALTAPSAASATREDPDEGGSNG
jgi:hypothetical protein